MDKVRNERGATLVISLLLILVIVILATSLASLAITSLKQSQLTEDNLELTSLAEMGVTHYQVLLNNIISENKSAPIETLRDLVDDYSSPSKYNVDEKRSYTVDVQVEKAESNELVLHIHSIGEMTTSNKTKDILSILIFKSDDVEDEIEETIWKLTNGSKILYNK
jgi:Tfp pilus assembly protein PilX